MQAASGQAAVIYRSEPIAGVVADPATPPHTRERLQLVEDARAFAIEQLALPDGRSYRKYADMGRASVVHNVVATPEFSVEPRRWCFPVSGCITYRGYFNEEDARRYGLRLAMKGDDVSVSGVPTYSTLGYLPDPVFGSDAGVARHAPRRHDLPRARARAAVFRGRQRVERSVRERGGGRGRAAVAAAAWPVGRDRGLRGVASRGKRSLRRCCRMRARGSRDSMRRTWPPEQKRNEKQREFGRLKYRYEVLRRERWAGYAGYDGWFARSLNNAHLAAVATYEDCVPGLQRLLQASGSLAVFYERVAATGNLTVKERRAALCESGCVPER